MDTTDTDAGATRIVLDVEAGAQPIRGFLRSESGRPEQFSGWLELTRVLERLIDEAAHRPGPPSDHLVP